jgi:hypothetical protein
MVANVQLSKVKSQPGARKIAAKADDLATWLDRNAACDLLNTTRMTLDAHERAGRLHPKKALRADRRGQERFLYVYDPQELAKIPQRGRSDLRAPGETAARAFELFAEGMPLDAILMELREQPAKIKELHEEWLDMSGARLVISPAAKASLEQLVGAFVDVAELLERVKAHVKA